MNGSKRKPMNTQINKNQQPPAEAGLQGGYSVEEPVTVPFSQPGETFKGVGRLLLWLSRMVIVVTVSNMDIP